MVKPVCFLATIVLATVVFGCKKNAEREPDSVPVTHKEDFSCVKLFDEVGQDVGLYGCTESNDWLNQSLSNEETAYFLSNDLVPLTDTDSIQVTAVALFPNPIVQDGFFIFRIRSNVGTGQVKLQLAVIDESKKVLTQISRLMEINDPVEIQVPAEKYNRGGFYRLYYRVSALGVPVLFEGHGNIVICKQPGAFDIDADCI